MRKQQRRNGLSMFKVPRKKREKSTGQSLSSTGLSKSPPIQRKIGFEVEIYNMLCGESKSPKYHEKRIYDDKHIWDLGIGNVLMADPLYEFQSEEGSTYESATEIVSKPFEEDMEGFYEMERFFKKLKRFEEVSARAPVITGLRPFAEAGLGEIRNPMALLCLRHVHKRGLRIRAQVTAGIRMKTLGQLLKDVGTGGMDETAEMVERKMAGRMALGTDYEGRFVDLPINMGRATIISEEALKRYWQQNSEAPGEGPNEELRGLLNLVAFYLIRGTLPISAYAKSFVYLLARTDFSAMFSRLPEEEKEHFSATEGREWSNIIRLMCSPGIYDLEREDWSLFQEMGIKETDCDPRVIDLSQPFFAQGIYRNRKRFPHRSPRVMDALTSGKWAFSIPRTDYLTRDTFPDPEARPRLESIGAMRGAMDTHPYFGDKMPIFELRNLSITKRMDDTISQMRKWFAYVFEMNQGRDYKYGEPHEEFGVE
ncbi:hypothetical protein [Fulvitalea axinellae]|uniref:hypothetical protein n=1 Tax=Fulvitalea axinellae TaxID=1182444 RepID=UPI0030CA21E8